MLTTTVNVNMQPSSKHANTAGFVPTATASPVVDVDRKQAMSVTDLQHLGQGSRAFVTNVVSTQVKSMYPGIP